MDFSVFIHVVNIVKAEVVDAIIDGKCSSRYRYAATSPFQFNCRFPSRTAGRKKLDSYLNSQRGSNYKLHIVIDWLVFSERFSNATRLTERAGIAMPILTTTGLTTSSLLLELSARNPGYGAQNKERGMSLASDRQPQLPFINFALERCVVPPPLNIPPSTLRCWHF